MSIPSFSATHAVLAACLATQANGQTPATGETRPGFAVVELFTSEGCSSCPPADRLLAEIDKWADSSGLPVYVLSFHVDYWDRLGWKDPYASAAYTGRQREYAAASNERSVYTPQMIVNGGSGFIGSDGKRAAAALGEAVAARPSASLALEASPVGQSYRLRYRATDAPPGSVINVALVEPAGTQNVARGENAGRQLAHVNIVRAFRQASVDPDGVGEITLAAPAGAIGPLETIVYLQEANTGRVLAAASAPAP